MTPYTRPGTDADGHPIERLTKLGQAAVVSVVPWVTELAGRFAERHGLDPTARDDVEGEAFAAVCRQLRYYDERRAKLTTFVALVATQAMGRALQAMRSRRGIRTERAGDPHVVRLGEVTADTIADPGTLGDGGSIADRYALDAVWGTLSDDERALLTARYGLDGRADMTIDDLARARGDSPFYVHTKLTRARKRIKERLTKGVAGG